MVLNFSTAQTEAATNAIPPFTPNHERASRVTRVARFILIDVARGRTKIPKNPVMKSSGPPELFDTSYEEVPGLRRQTVVSVLCLNSGGGWAFIKMAKRLYKGRYPQGIRAHLTSHSFNLRYSP